MVETLLVLCMTFAAPDEGDFPREAWESDCVSAATYHHKPQDRPRRIVVAASEYRGMGSGNVEQWRPLVSSYFPADTVDRMLCLMSYESGGNHLAKNPRSSASGLFQIMSFWWNDTYNMDPFHPESNVQMARWIWDQQGYHAWNPYGRGLCH